MTELELLIQQKTEIDAKIKELKRLEELKEKQLTVNFYKFNPVTGKIHVAISKYDTPIVNWLRDNCPERFYTNGENIISHIHIPKLEPFLSGLEYVTVMWGKGDKEKYEEFLTRPDVFVKLDKSWVVLELGPRLAGVDIWLNNEISSFNIDVASKVHKFAIAELYKFPKALEAYRGRKIENVKYSPEAEKELFSQLERRRLIAELANAKDAEVTNPFGIETGFDLKAHQRVAVKYATIAANGCLIRSIIAYDMGTGKTFVAMGLAELNKDKWKKVLVICPASLKTNWRRHIKKATGEDAVVFSGIEPDDLAIDALFNPRNRYFIINFDIIGRAVGEKKNPRGEVIKEGVMKWVLIFNAAQIDFTIIDEAHYIKNLDSKRSKGVRALDFKNVLPMTGTPVVNRPMELWPLLNIVDPATFNSSSQFASQFIDYDGKPRNVAKLHEMMLPYMIRRTRTDVYGELHVERIPFSKELSPQARDNYTKIMEGIYISLRKPDYQRNVTSILAELLRCKQTCSSDNVSASVELAMEAVEETGKKVIICSQFKESQYAIQNLLGTAAVVINGDVTDDDRYSSMDRFQDPSSNLKYWITNIPEGLTLTEAHTVIFNDLWWTPKDHAQLEGRAFGRDNDPHGGNSYFIQNENTVDEFINGLLIQKMAVINELVDGIRNSQEDQGDIVKLLIEHLRNSI